MNPRNAYKQQSAPPARIDLALEIYERLLARLREARALFPTNPNQARLQLSSCQAAVTALAAGQDLSAGEVAENFLRLYEFVAHALSEGTEAGTQTAIDVLTPLHEAFVAARPEALNLERQGQIPSLGQPRVSAMA